MERVIVADEPALGQELFGARPERLVVVDAARSGGEAEAFGRRELGPSLGIAQDKPGFRVAYARGDFAALHVSQWWRRKVLLPEAEIFKTMNRVYLPAVRRKVSLMAAVV